METDLLDGSYVVEVDILKDLAFSHVTTVDCFTSRREIVCVCVCARVLYYTYYTIYMCYTLSFSLQAKAASPRLEGKLEGEDDRKNEGENEGEEDVIREWMEFQSSRKQKKKKK